MFERFNEQARRSIQLAQEEARALKHAHIGPEHLLLGVLRADGLGAHALKQLGISVDRARPQVVAILGADTGDDAVSGQIPFTPQAKKTMELALREALSMRHDYIGTEHILLSLVSESENESATTRILLDLGAPAQQIRNQVLRWLPGPGGHLQTSQTPGLEWRRARTLWRPEGLELRLPLHLPESAMAAFASDEVWTQRPLPGLRREIWDGWLALASPTLLDDVDPVALRRLLDGAIQRALNGNEGEGARAEAFLRGIRGDSSGTAPAEEPPDTPDTSDTP